MKKIRYIIFLKDVLLLALSAFGGPQAHISMFLKRMVEKRAYLTEEELIELNALCQILPGPTSTQTIIAIGFKVGKANLAFLTLLVWILPAGMFMILIAVYLTHLENAGISLDFTKYIQPMAVGFISYAAWKITTKVVTTKTGVSLMVASAIIAYLLSFFYGHLSTTSFVFPMLLILGGAVSSVKYRQQKRVRQKKDFTIEWKNFILWIGVFIGVALIGKFTASKFVLLFEKFYRNGSLIFGGGQVLIPLLKAEFVDYKHFLTNDEFLSGFSFVNAMPGPVFSFTGYIGALSCKEMGIGGQIFGGIVSLAGIFLPGTFLIFFVIPFWEELKKFRIVRASLEGVSAVGSGLVIAAALLLLNPINTTLTPVGFINIGIIGSTIGLLIWDKIPPPFIILTGLAAGFIF